MRLKVHRASSRKDGRCNNTDMKICQQITVNRLKLA